MTLCLFFISGVTGLSRAYLSSLKTTNLYLHPASTVIHVVSRELTHTWPTNTRVRVPSDHLSACRDGVMFIVKSRLSKPTSIVPLKKFVEQETEKNRRRVLYLLPTFYKTLSFPPMVELLATINKSRLPLPCTARKPGTQKPLI